MTATVRMAKTEATAMATLLFRRCFFIRRAVGSSATAKRDFHKSSLFLSSLKSKDAWAGGKAKLHVRTGFLVHEILNVLV